MTFSPLSSLQAGEQGTLYKLRGSDEDDPDLEQLGLTLGTVVTLVCHSPQLIIQVRGEQFPISTQLAQQISVRLEPTCPVVSAPGNQTVWTWIRSRFPGWVRGRTPKFLT